MPKNSQMAAAIRRKVEDRLTPIPTDGYIEPFENIKAGDRILVICRTSRRTEFERSNALDQDEFLKQQIREAGAIHAYSYRFWGSVRGCKDYDADSWAEQAAYFARKHGATILLAESPSRFLRNPLYDPNDEQARLLGPTRYGLEALRSALGADLRLMTYLDPNASADEERSQQTKRGMRQKSKLGGRPSKANNHLTQRKPCKAIRVNLLPIARNLRDKGHSYTQIATILNKGDESPISRSTIIGWLKQ